MSRSLARSAVLTMATGAALVGGAATPTLVSAQPRYDRYYYDDYCRHRRSGNTAAGAIVGGIAGALIGHGVTRGDDRGAGTAVGALVGGTTGAAVASSSTRCYNDRDYYPRYRYGRYYENPPDYGYQRYHEYPHDYYRTYPRYYDYDDDY